VLGIFFVVQVLAWWLLASWGARGLVLLVTLFLLPVVRVLLFDKR
jgi:hypothetical protein